MLTTLFMVLVLILVGKQAMLVAKRKVPIRITSISHGRDSRESNLHIEGHNARLYVAGGGYSKY
jgi:hypothetical protein